MSSREHDAKPEGEETPDVAEALDLASPELFLNRELTWLAFNQRVLAEASDERTPLLERLKFLAIVSSNLDEFFQKRIGGLKQQVGAGIRTRTVDGRTPEEQIVELTLRIALCGFFNRFNDTLQIGVEDGAVADMLSHGVTKESLPGHSEAAE